MRKFAIVLSTTALLVLAGCVSDDSGAKADEVSVDKNLLTVDVTIPKSFFEDLGEGGVPTQAELDAEAKEAGYKSAKLNSDGSVTYTMSKKVHEEVLNEMKSAIDESIKESLDEYPGVFKSITYDKDVKNFTLEVDRQKFDSEFGVGFVGFGLAIQSGFYQMFSVGTGESKTVIEYKDSATGEVFDTTVWPDDLED